MFPTKTVLLAMTLFAAWAIAESDPWKDSDVIQPAMVAAQLKSDPKPVVLYAGFPVLYRARHIVGAVLVGPASKPEGLELLKQAAASLPRDSEIVIYCGCCPWDRCPNIRPAFRMLHDMGFTKVKVVSIPTNLATDWTAKGYPVESSAAKSE